MILHIFKRDIRILWPYVLGAAVTDLAAAVLQTLMEAVQLRADAQILSPFLWAVNTIALLFGFAVITMVVQLDPIPGARQDWLARPIGRRDLLMAKLLFVVIFLQVPLLVADTLHGLLSGFPLGRTLEAAGARNVYLLILMSLPVMALAAMTTSIKQALGLGLAVAVAAVAVAGAVLEVYALVSVSSDNAHTMTSFVLQMAVLLAGAAAILVLQYFKRATRTSRLLLGAAAILALAAHFLLPQDTAYAIENRISPRPGRDVSLAFAPSAEKLRGASNSIVMAGSESATERSTLVALPLAVAGLPPQMTLIGENVRAILTAPNGETLTLEARDFPMQGPNLPANIYYQMLRLPGSFFDAHRNEAVRVELDYQLALHGPLATYEMAAQSGELNIPRLGRCATIIGPFGTDVLLHCMQVGEEHMRVDVALTDDAKGLSNPVRRIYSPSDAFYRNGDDIISRFNASLFFRDNRSDTPFPVGAAQIPEATVRLRVSEPLTWTMRRVTIANLRLDEWTTKR